ncbi:MAG: histidine phosphotransferase family protein [Rhodospirillales bacterium]
MADGELRIMQLLCSRLCHDLVGPVSAMNNGVELIEDSPGMLSDSLSLIDVSAKQASRRLAFFRAAFGFGGDDGPGALKDIRSLTADFTDGGNVVLDWPDAAAAPAVSRDAAKLILNMVLLGIGALPRGGALTVHIGEIGDGCGIALTAAGKGAAVKDDIYAAMAADFPLDDLSAHTVQGYFTTRLARAAGAEIEVMQNGDGEVQLAAVVPSKS